MDKKEDDLLNLKKEKKGMFLVWECSGIQALLRDAKDSRTLLSLPSSLWNWKDEEEEGRTVSQVEEVAMEMVFWLANCWLSL